MGRTIVAGVGGFGSGCGLCIVGATIVVWHVRSALVLVLLLGMRVSVLSCRVCSLLRALYALCGGRWVLVIVGIVCVTNCVCVVGCYLAVVVIGGGCPWGV
eukprot:6395404-Amphidinium_carterae.2